jgi:uncharacterized protein YkwD
MEVVFMYWGQTAIALAVGMASVYTVLQQGYSEVPSLLIGVVGFILARWLFTWMFRVKYWYRSKSPYSERCPNCRRDRRRLRGDWILECKSCEWKAGFPILRWFTYSVPAQQFRRTVVGPGFVVVVLSVGLVLSGATAGVAVSDISVPDSTETDTPGTEGTLVDDESDDQFSTDSSVGNSIDRTVIEDESETQSPSGGLNESAVEILVFELINEERSNWGSSSVSMNSELRSVAQEHSQDMHNRDFYAHTNPDGAGPLERADSVITCDAVSENIHRGELHPEMRSLGTSTSFDTRTTDGMANFIVYGWMHSDPHRNNMLDDRWEYIGVGVRIEDSEFFATAMFC